MNDVLLEIFRTRVRLPAPPPTIYNMQKLFENWRKYVNESNEPDHLSDEAELAVHPEADVGQPEEGDNQKLLDVFWSSGVQALQLAEMTGNEEMALFFREIIKMVRDHIGLLDRWWPEVRQALRTRHTRNFTQAPGKPKINAEHIIKLAGYVRERTGVPGIENIKGIEKWGDDLIEAGDYAWYHPTNYSIAYHARVHHLASEELATNLYMWFRKWAGMDESGV